MNLDDLMEVWRSQDASPLHGVNETLVRLALRQDEAKLQANGDAGRDGSFTLLTAFVVADMARVLSIMIYRYDDDVLSGWDYAIPVVGAAAALLWVRMMYVRQPGAGVARATLWRLASRSNQPATRAARLRGDDRPPGEPAGHAAAADRLRVRHHPRQLADQRPIVQRCLVVGPDRLHDLLGHHLRGRHLLVGAPLGATEDRCPASAGWRRC